MSQRQPLAYGDMRPKLEPDDVDGKPAVLTVKRADRRNMARRGQGEEWKVVVVFADTFPGKSVRDAEPSTEREHVLNATDWKTVSGKLGDDETTWAGKKFVMAPGTTQYEGRTFEKMLVATPDRWDKALAAVAKKAGK